MNELRNIGFVCLCLTASGTANATNAHQASQWPERPGDIIISRDVPRQNAVLVGEPGRPTIANPGAMVIAASRSHLNSGMFAQPLTDLEAQAVRGARTPQGDKFASAEKGLLPADWDSAISNAGTIQGPQGASSFGTTIANSIGGATRQIQGTLSSALRQGGL